MTASGSTHPFNAADSAALGARLEAVSELAASVAEAHGVLCGLICAGVPEPERVWIDELLAGADRCDLSVRDCQTSLRALGADTRERIEGGATGLRPLLPGEGAPLAERALALYDWTRGLLYGLGLGRVAVASLSEPAREAIDDLGEITRLDLDALDEGEDNEEALAELEEFAWVAAMLVHEELGQREAQP